VFVDGALTSINGIFGCCETNQDTVLVMYVVTTPSFVSDGSFLSYIQDIVNCLVHRGMAHSVVPEGSKTLTIQLESATDIFPDKSIRKQLVEKGFRQGLAWCYAKR
jgi:hypothetical protein